MSRVPVKYCMTSHKLLAFHGEEYRKYAKLYTVSGPRTLYISTTFEGTIEYTPSQTLACECGTATRKDSA